MTSLVDEADVVKMKDFMLKSNVVSDRFSWLRLIR